MKKLRVLFVIAIPILVYFGARIVRSVSVEEEVIELKTDHFVLSYHGIYKHEAQALADKLESNSERIRTHLKDPVHRIVRVFVHPTQEDFNKATELTNSNANGTSRGPNEFHLLWTNWFNSVFPDDPTETAVHEFTHCVQLNILLKDAEAKWSNEDRVDFNKAFEENFINEYPQWFWEAICDYEAGMVNSISVKYAMRKTPTLKSLNNSNQIYNVGYTIIEYIVEKWGDDRLHDLIRTYVDIEAVLGVSEFDFERGWIEFVTERY